MTERIVIIGTGLAGYQLAKEFRKLDSTSELILISSDAGAFYSKPLLSTALTAKKTAANLAMATAESMATQLNAQIYTFTSVTRIDSTAGIVWCQDQAIHYSKLVLACGADFIKPPLGGNAVEQVIAVNQLHHYETFHQAIQGKRRITILGAGLIGCEFANDLCNAGYEVHVIAPSTTPLELLVPAKIGKILQDDLAAHGVKWHLGTIATTIDHMSAGLQLTLADNTMLETDVVLSAIGLMPHIGLAKTAQLKVNRGIIVNRWLETSNPNIYALGDCAEVEGHILPYIAPLLNGARALAQTLAGVRTPVKYPAMPIIVKTPIHPLVICLPPKNIAGDWQITGQDRAIKALFYDNDSVLQGFILTNQAVKERSELLKSLPGLF